MRHVLSLLVAVATLSLPSLSAAQDKPAGMTFTPYGFVLLQTFANSGNFATKDNANQVNVPSINSSGGSYLMGARGSRLGFKLGNLDSGDLGAKVSGVLEVDFHGGYIATNSSGWNQGIMRLRLANAKLDWATSAGNFQILAGQDFALLLNQNPNSVTYAPDPVFVQSGNLYRRTPQLRATLSRSRDAFGYEIAAAVLSPTDADCQSASPCVDYGVGNKSRMPDVEARVAASFKSGDAFSGTVGVGYMVGKRRYFLTDPAGDTHKDIDRSLLGIDADFGITQYLQLKGEYYRSSGAEDGYSGNAWGVFPANPPSTTVSTADIKAVTSDGYWAQLTLKPIPLLWIAAGYGNAKAGKSKIAPGTGNANKVESTQIHGALILNAGKNLKIGLEMAQTETKFLNADQSTNGQKAEQYSLSVQVPF
jgi:hypothetical protein